MEPAADFLHAVAFRALRLRDQGAFSTAAFRRKEQRVRSVRAWSRARAMRLVQLAKPDGVCGLSPQRKWANMDVVTGRWRYVRSRRGEDGPYAPRCRSSPSLPCSSRGQGHAQHAMPRPRGWLSRSDAV